MDKEFDAECSDFKQRFGLKQFIGRSASFLEAIQCLPRYAGCNAAVFITGETGTGKEMAARAIHYLGCRAGQPFVPVNCGAIPGELVENELFGHERGAFTGATTATRGLVAEADRGTLFLDEVDALPQQTQVKFLRFLQEREYRPLGSRKTLRADVRIIAAANSDLQGAGRNGRFRADLFFRLNVLPLNLPPLRRRKDDIPALAAHFAVRYAEEFEVPQKALSPCALEKLAAYDWPGNVRELENIIQRAVVLAEGAEILAADIGLPQGDDPPVLKSFKTLKAEMVAAFERDYLRQLLAVHNGNITHAAQAARKNRRAFWQLLRKHKISATPDLAAAGDPASRQDKITPRQDKFVLPAPQRI